MPWKIEKRENQYCVVKESDGSTVACHATEEMAKKQLAALYASEKGARHNSGDRQLIANIHDMGGQIQAAVAGMERQS